MDQSFGQGYRPNVGIAVFNAQGQVLIAERHNAPGSWQMPQGGIDKGEDPWIAALRELKEEIGTNSVTYLGETEGWLRYDFPRHVLNDPSNSHGYRGQEQKWFAVRFTGKDGDIALDSTEPREFTHWKWIDLAQAVDLIVEFKRPVYIEMARHFARFAENSDVG
jgi:putative (di)nucleoside polyphosphate hydrolase